MPTWNFVSIYFCTKYVLQAAHVVCVQLNCSKVVAPMPYVRIQRWQMKSQNVWIMSLCGHFFKVLSLYLEARIWILIRIRIQVTSRIRIRIKGSGLGYAWK